MSTLKSRVRAGAQTSWRSRAIRPWFSYSCLHGCTFRPEAGTPTTSSGLARGLPMLVHRVHCRNASCCLRVMTRTSWQKSHFWGSPRSNIVPTNHWTPHHPSDCTFAQVFWRLCQRIHTSYPRPPDSTFVSGAIMFHVRCAPIQNDSGPPQGLPAMSLAR